jgi:hypothetical protein
MSRGRYNTAAVDRPRVAVAALRLRGMSQRDITDTLPLGILDRRKDASSRRPHFALWEQCQGS